MTETERGEAERTFGTVAERSQRSVTGQTVRFGLPLPRAYCFDAGRLGVSAGSGSALPAEITVTALWPDRSIRWCLVTARVTLAAGAGAALAITRDAVDPVTPRAAAADATDPGDPPPVSEQGNLLEVATARGKWRFDRETFSASFIDPEGRAELQLRPLLTVAGAPCEARVTRSTHRTRRAGRRVLLCELSMEGPLQLPDGREVLGRLRLQIDEAGCRVAGDFRLHNPEAATHPGGHWDLGDPASVDIDSLELLLSIPKATGARLRLDDSSEWCAVSGPADLTQYASGGELWQSPVHVERDGAVHLTEPGFVLKTQAGVRPGRRAQPLFQVHTPTNTLSVHLAQFWENFPSALRWDGHELGLGLFAATGRPQELQPGERKTRRFDLRWAGHGETDAPAGPLPHLVVTLSPEYVELCAVPELGAASLTDERLGSLVATCLDAGAGFAAKRETIDEYGWRHFGELYADHETDGYDGEQPFVSHYNNQYDPLFGLLRQHLFTGDGRWFELAEDLARHVTDIDIYHTRHDRPEYNGGLFWHTDHYLPAETATHRAYSRHQRSGAYEGHAHGGGPGGQHCYTTGLLLHYLLTGEEDSRDALVSLTRWITRVYEGGDGLLDALLALKQRHRPDLKNRLTERYPFDRGTANYLVALLDCHSLDGSAATLRQAEHVIAHTAHPGDDLEQRQLQDIEAHWYYIVFLQALCRYLEIKHQARCHDESFRYGKAVLLHYARWTLANDGPYLDRRERLEFPNHTWTAQDLRKATVLYWAAAWSDDADEADGFRDRARFFVEYVTGTLAAEPTLRYTRIQALLLQNLFPTRPLPARTVPPSPASIAPARHPGRVLQVAAFLRLLFRGFRRANPRAELDTLRRLLGKPRPHRAGARD